MFRADGDHSRSWQPDGGVGGGGSSRGIPPFGALKARDRFSWLPWPGSAVATCVFWQGPSRLPDGALIWKGVRSHVKNRSYMSDYKRKVRFCAIPHPISSFSLLGPSDLRVKITLTTSHKTLSPLKMERSRLFPFQMDRVSQLAYQIRVSDS